MGTKVNVYVANGYTEPIWVKITDKDSGIKIPSGNYNSEGYTQLPGKTHVRVEPKRFASIVSTSGKEICKGKSYGDCGIIVNKNGDAVNAAFNCIWTDRLGRGHEF